MCIHVLYVLLIRSFIYIYIYIYMYIIMHFLYVFVKNLLKASVSKETLLGGCANPRTPFFILSGAGGFGGRSAGKV